MSYDWLEAFLMGVIFLAAVLFATRHFAPSNYSSARNFFLRENTLAIGLVDIGNTSGIACQTKCSACNGCSLANKN